VKQFLVLLLTVGLTTSALHAVTYVFDISAANPFLTEGGTNQESFQITPVSGFGSFNQYNGVDPLQQVIFTATIFSGNGDYSITAANGSTAQTPPFGYLTYQLQFQFDIHPNFTNTFNVGTAQLSITDSFAEDEQIVYNDSFALPEGSGDTEATMVYTDSSDLTPFIGTGTYDPVLNSVTVFLLNQVGDPMTVSAGGTITMDVDVQYITATVPEPSVTLLMGVGVVGLAAARFRRKV
jgi:hypothetical protein